MFSTPQSYSKPEHPALEKSKLRKKILYRKGFTAIIKCIETGGKDLIVRRPKNSTVFLLDLAPFCGLQVHRTLKKPCCYYFGPSVFLWVRDPQNFGNTFPQNFGNTLSYLKRKTFFFFEGHKL